MNARGAQASSVMREHRAGTTCAAQTATMHFTAAHHNVLMDSRRHVRVQRLQRHLRVDKVYLSALLKAMA